MRHVTRTMRIDIDWLFERIKTDKGIFLKYVNTKEQLADVLTKGSFTATQWSHLIDLCCLGPLLAGRNSTQSTRQHEPPRTPPQQRQHLNQERQQHKQGSPNQTTKPSVNLCLFLKGNCHLAYKVFQNSFEE